MRRYEERTSTRTYKELVERCCDLCGRKAKDKDWDAGAYEINETDVRVEVRQKDGSSFPEGGCGTELNIDLCPPCFTGRLVPWLISQGAKIEQREWDW